MRLQDVSILKVLELASCVSEGKKLTNQSKNRGLIFKKLSSFRELMLMKKVLKKEEKRKKKQ